MKKQRIWLLVVGLLSLAAAGGGGKGMRRVESADQLERALGQARREVLENQLESNRQHPRRSQRVAPK